MIRNKTRTKLREKWREHKLKTFCPDIIGVLDGCDLITAISVLQEYLEKIPEEYKNKAILNMHYDNYEERSTILSLEYSVPETDAEVDVRIDRMLEYERALKEKRKQQELKDYERLRKKFG